MFRIIFLNLFIFIYNLYQVEIPYLANFFHRKSKNEYILVSLTDRHRKAFTLNIDTDNITLVDEKELNDGLRDFQLFENDLFIYSYDNRAVIDYKGKEKTIYTGNYFGERLQTQAYSNNILLLCSSHYTSGNSPYYLYHIDMFLHLVKKPYNEISKSEMIEFDTSDNFVFRLIALKDCFVFIKSNYPENDEEGNVNAIFKIVDFELNSINNVTIEFKKVSSLKYSQLSEKGKVNEFLLCINYIDEPEIQCKIIKYENKNLIPLKTIAIPYPLNSYYFLINNFDEDKIGCYIYASRID